MADRIQVQVIHLTRDRTYRRALELSQGSTVMQAVQASGIAVEADLEPLEEAKFGIFSRRVQADAELTQGDRVEIYRELYADPKDARRRRADSPD